MTDLEAIRKRDAEGARPFAHRDLLEEVDRLNKALETEKKIQRMKLTDIIITYAVGICVGIVVTLTYMGII